MKHLIVLSGPEQTEQDRRLIRLAAWMGVPTGAVLIRDGDPIGQRLLDALTRHCAIAMSARTLATLQAAVRTSTDVRSFLDGACAELLIFDCSGSLEEIEAISGLMKGEVTGVSRTDGPEITISFPTNARDCSRQLAGLSYMRRGGAPLTVFALREEPHRHTVIASANGQPMFVQFANAAMQVYLLGGPPLADLDEPLSREYEVKQHYDRLLPTFMFLRQCFAELCWHNPRPAARLILDDPLLKQKYGFLDYRLLLRSMQRQNYGTSIAFIPWNCWRTSKRDVQQLLGDARLSLCIHGCDHANREFEGRDPVMLRRKAGLALQRMESLHSRTGAEFDPVMVFPQERYSTAAIGAMRAQPYLAIINTICVPIDSRPDDLRLRDFLLPAITCYHGFPIFQRRYPRRLIDFASDLFLGRPALVVEHHDYFRNGNTPLEEFVSALLRIEPGLRWPDLRSLVAECCLWRRTGNGSADVRFFTRRFVLKSSEGEAVRCLLSKHEPDEGRIRAVLVNGRPADFAFEGESLKVEVMVEPGRAHEIEIVDRQERHEPVRGFGLRHNSRVLARRVLSEFRDNTLSRHRGLQLGAQWVADRLNVTGAGYDDTERYESYEEGCPQASSYPNPADGPSI